MSHLPLVSVIVSAYNTEKYIEEALVSILHQDYGNIEIIIADDSSADRTKFLIDSIDDPRIKTFHNASNLGYLATWNKLLPEARGKYFTFQDADDASHPSRIRKLVDFMEKHPDVGLCGSNFVRFFRPWGLYYESKFPLTQEEIDREIVKGNIPFPGTRVMIRREVYEKVGGFRPYFNKLTWEDYDWILRIRQHFKVANIPDILYDYRYYRSSSSKQSIQSSVEKMYVDKVGLFLAAQREEHGADALNTGNLSEIDNYIKSLQQAGEPDVTSRMLYTKVLRNTLSNRDYRNAFRFFTRRVKEFPFERGNLSDLSMILSAVVRTVIKAFYYRLTNKSKYSLNDY